MPTKNLIDAQHYLDTKCEWILNTFMGGVIDDYNTDYGLTGGKALRKPKSFFINTDAVGLGALSSSPLDTLPFVLTRITGVTTTEDNLINDRDLKVLLEINVANATDYGGIDWAAKQTRYLAIAAEQVLEAYLPDQAQDPDGCVIYNTRLVSNNGASIIPLQDQSQHVVVASCVLEVSMRANFLYDATTISPIMPQNPWLAFAFRPPTITLDTDTAVVIGPADPQSNTPVSITVGDLAGATSIDITAAYPDNSVIYAINQKTAEKTTGTIIGGVASLPLASISIANGNVWTLTIVNADNAVPGAYVLEWSVV